MWKSCGAHTSWLFIKIIIEKFLTFLIINMDVQEDSSHSILFFIEILRDDEKFKKIK